MSRYCGETKTGPILAAAEHWKQRCLAQDGAVFSDQAVWATPQITPLVDHYVNNLDLGEGHFLDKLESQLKPVSSAAKQLAAEMQWVMLLCPSNISAANKKEVIGRVWEWSGQPAVVNSPWLSDEVLAGIGSAGTSYNTNRWRELVFFVRLTQAVKTLSLSDRDHLLGDGLAFAQFMESVPECESRQLRHMLLFLLWPDSFERVFGGTDRRAIVAAFTGRSHGQVGQLSALQIDGELAAIRKAQEERFNTRELDFYAPPLKAEWKQESIPKTITRDHVLQAIHEVDLDGYPEDARSTTYDLIHQGHRYPPKYILALAGKHATGEELDRASFTGGETSTAFSVLRKLGFVIERKDFVPELVRRFIAQADGPGDLSVSGYPKSYCGLDVDADRKLTSKRG
jgi:5-methylcytosine-specific restriction protein B